MRATAAAAPSNTMFSISCTLICSALIEMAHDEPVRGWRLARKVHDIRHLTSFFELFDDAHRLRGDRFLCLIGRRADVMRAVESFFFNDLVVEFAGAAR